ncbi:MAG: RNA polymerase factor sigma-54 [Acidobacteriia bacterium]|nr:RNA polymerase factor sigma-54 [Terriglobia bacterium]
MSSLQPKLSLRVAQKQILTPGLVQMVSLLALNNLELGEMVRQEMMENPVLEEIALEGPPVEEEGEAQAVEERIRPSEERPREKTAAEPFPDENAGANGDFEFSQYFDAYFEPSSTASAGEVIERPSFENFLSKPMTLSDHLMWQVGVAAADEAVLDAAEEIVGNLDEDGFLKATLEEIAVSSGYPLEQIEKGLKLVQELDPAGVGARDLRECLLIQLHSMGEPSSLAIAIVENHLRQLQNKQYREISRAVNRPVTAVTNAVELIKSLDPRPGQRYNKTEARLIHPDVFFVKVGDKYNIVLNEDDIPQLRLSQTYRKMVEKNGAPKEVREYVRERFGSALQLLKNIEQRKLTILRVCESLVYRQREFLDGGIDFLKPMMIKEVAEELGVHPSTVSRAVAHKYAHTPQGVFELRFFFSEAVSGPMGSETSLIILKRRVKKMIEDENPQNPLTDEEITRQLNAEGIQVTRRTVAKYREDMKIPSTHQRRVKN